MLYGKSVGELIDMEKSLEPLILKIIFIANC